MGAAIANQILQADNLNLALVTARKGNPMVGSKFANTNLVVETDLDAAAFDVLIDFTTPEAMLGHLDYCLQNKTAMVIGVTGLSDQQLDYLLQAAQQIPIVYSANMSLGINICYKLLSTVSKIVDQTWNVAISDVHHQHKKDSPSGTAKQLAKIIASERNIDPESVMIKSERRGEVVGEHTVTFSNPAETITISHVANTRDIFANGALNAATWVFSKKEPGLYSMMDVIA